jgi:tetratricopeptide (TPR) repeat protein
MPALPERDPYAQGLEFSRENRHFEAIECFEKALAKTPNDIRVLFALGNTASALGMPKPAEELFRQVLALEPHRVEALVNLANLLRAQGQFDAAQSLLAPAVARTPGSPELQLTFGSVFREKGDNARAAIHFREALKLRPDYPPALGNLADILADEGDIEEALSFYDRVIASDPGNAQARLNRSVMHLLAGNLADGWRDYAARLDVEGKVPVADRTFPLWNGGSLKNQMLLIRAEQGVGDQIMFASLIPELAARAADENGRLILECDARLVPLFARSFPNVSVRAANLETRGGIVSARYDGLGVDATAAVLLGSLAGLFRNDTTRFPVPHRYLCPDQDDVQHWREEFKAAGPGPHIGVCWRSGAKGGGRAVQYAPLEAWADFIRALPGTVMTAQYDATAEEIRQLEALSGRRLIVARDLDQKNELDRTCAMLSALDAVASAPTAVSWLAAAAGVPTFKILYDTSWTGFGLRYEPFAPSAALMMPKARGDWSDAFGQAAGRISVLYERV